MKKKTKKYKGNISSDQKQYNELVDQRNALLLKLKEDGKLTKYHARYYANLSLRISKLAKRIAEKKDSTTRYALVLYYNNGIKKMHRPVKSKITAFNKLKKLKEYGEDLNWDMYKSLFEDFDK